MSEPVAPDLNFVDDDSVNWKRYGLPLALAIVLAFVALALFLNWKITQDNKNTAALDALSQAKTTEERRVVIDRYLGTPAAAAGLIGLAEELYAKPDYDASIAAYEKFLSNYPSHPLQNGARMGLASALEAAGKLPEAVQAYSTAAHADPSDIYNAPAYLALARLQLLQKNTAASRQALEECVAKFGTTSAFGTEARLELEKLPKS